MLVFNVSCVVSLISLCKWKLFWCKIYNWNTLKQACTTCGLSSLANFLKILSSKRVCCVFRDIRDKNAVNQGFWSKTTVFSLPATKMHGFHTENWGPRTEDWGVRIEKLRIENWWVTSEEWGLRTEDSLTPTEDTSTDLAVLINSFGLH